MKKLIAIVVAVALLLTVSVSTPVVANSVWHVYPDNTAGATPIQDAVDAADSGDTIVVHKGEYYEQIAINTNYITLKGKGKVILDGTEFMGPGVVPGIWIMTGTMGVKIKGFEIRNYDAFESGEVGVGIWMESGSYDNIITKNKVSNCVIGIMASTSDGNTIKKNRLNDCFVGIGVERASHYNKVTNNKITDSELAGIIVDEESTYNIIVENEVSNSGLWGIILGRSHNNKVRYNEVEDSGLYGISLESGASNNEIKENEVEDSGTYDCFDSSSGSGTAGTANTWIENECDTSSPDGLCCDDDDDDEDDDD